MTNLHEENKILKEKIKTLNKISYAFSNTSDTNELLQMILEESMNLTFSDGGSIYIKEKVDSKECMVIKHSANQSIDFEFRGEVLAIDENSKAGTVALNGKTLVMNSIDENDVKGIGNKEYKVKNMMTVPMKNEIKEVIGILQILNKKKLAGMFLKTEDDFINNVVDYTDEDMEQIESLASQLAVLIDRIKLNKRLLRNVSQTRTTLISFFNGMKQAMATIGEDIMEEQDKFKEYATLDTLTGLMTRREGLAFLKKQLEFARFNGVKVVFCFIDINGLKEINDTYGHDAGDDLISSVSRIIKKNARGNDTIFRYGGDEFILVIDNIDKKTAEFVWRRIELNFEEYNNKSGKEYKLSASHGFAEYDPYINQSIDELLKISDSEMYKNKKIMKSQK